MNKAKILLNALTFLIFSGCVQKEYIKTNDYEFLTLKEVKPIRMYFQSENEKIRYENYIKKLRAKINFYEWQIRIYNEIKNKGRK